MEKFNSLFFIILIPFTQISLLIEIILYSMSTIKWLQPILSIVLIHKLYGYHILPQLLKYEDKNSMCNSIETRLPMLDFRFVQQAISIKDELKFKDGYLKYLLRIVADKILPKNIVWRKSKFGFEAPTDTWIDKNFDNMVEEISKSSLILHILDINSNLYKNKLILWRLYNIALWERVYGVKIR